MKQHCRQTRSGPRNIAGIASAVQSSERFLIIVNLSDYPAQSRVKVPWADANGVEWLLQDAISGANYERPLDEMRSLGPYVELAPRNYHFFEFLRTPALR
jgi:hypothetical protein